jgi:hypothetical protein
MVGWLLVALLLGDPATAGKTKPAPAAAPAKAQAPAEAPTGQAVPGAPIRMDGRDQVDASVPQKYRDEVLAAQIQGAMLQQEDVAVWLASNALVKAGTKPPGAATGWFAVSKDDKARNWKVSFTAQSGAKQVVYADVDVGLIAPPPKINFQPHPQGRELSGDELILVKARDEVAGRKNWLRCADDYNYSVSFRQGKKGRETVVRALPARHEQKLYLLGGFHEFVASDKGGKMKQFQQTNTCLELELPKHGRGFVVSHLRSSTPTQFHVFASLSYGRPVYVKIENRTWLVKDGLVSVIDKNSLKSLKMEKPPAR